MSTTTKYGFDLSNYPTSIYQLNKQPKDAITPDNLEPGKIYMSNMSKLYLCLRRSYKIPSYTIPSYTIPGRVTIDEMNRTAAPRIVAEQTVPAQTVPAQIVDEQILNMSSDFVGTIKEDNLLLYPVKPLGGGGKDAVPNMQRNAEETLVVGIAEIKYIFCKR